MLALYQAYGLDMFEHLRGEFAFCLYDEERKLFLAARDRYGIKPLFYTVQAGRLLVAAEAKAFLPLGWTPEWDVRSLVEGGWNFDDRTLFKDVRKVRPGCYMTCDASGKIEQRRYWDLEYPDKVCRLACLIGVPLTFDRRCEICGPKRRLSKACVIDWSKQFVFD